MTIGKKRVDFSVRPRAIEKELPADADKWVREGRAPVEEGSQKRLTLNLPAGLHTMFKGRCVLEGITIQDTVRVLIECELAAGERLSAAVAQPLTTPGESAES
jgi:hypothetical protein